MKSRKHNKADFTEGVVYSHCFDANAVCDGFCQSLPVRKHMNKDYLGHICEFLVKVGVELYYILVMQHINPSSTVSTGCSLRSALHIDSTHLETKEFALVFTTICQLDLLGLSISLSPLSVPGCFIENKPMLCREFDLWTNLLFQPLSDLLIRKQRCSHQTGAKQPAMCD